MMNTYRNRLALPLVLGLLAGACDLDLINPNAPTEEAVISSPDGVIALAVGMQAQFAQTIDDYVVPTALVTDEWGTRTASLLSYQSLFTGQSFENTYDVVSSPYNQTYQIVKSANTLLTAAPNVGFGPALQAGITATAKLFKAMALGMASNNFEQLPVNIATEGAPLFPREQVRDTVLALLESARADIANVADADLAGLRSRVLGTGINLRNTIDAMIARYALFQGQHQRAAEAASRVSPTVLSTLTYPAPTRNPVYNLAFLLRYVGGTVNFVQGAEPNDRRPGYWLDVSTAPTPGNPADSLQYSFRRYAAEGDPFPLYLPDEMKLIRAEAAARGGDLATARTLINEVRTQTTSVVDEPVAGLPALTAADLPSLDAVLRQIAYERRYELYMQGLRWEDTRRLPAASTVIMQFLPTPAGECRTNPNATGAPGC